MSIDQIKLKYEKLKEELIKQEILLKELESEEKTVYVYTCESPLN